MRLLGLDPGLRHTGWGVIDVSGNRLTHVADGAVHSDDGAPLAQRLCRLHEALSEVLERYRPDEAAVEETFVNANAASTLKLGQARAVSLLVPALAGLAVAEYPNNQVKKAVVGQGRADKAQVQAMVRLLLPGCAIATPDAADALAVAVCHAHHRSTWAMWRRPAQQAQASPPPQPLPRGGRGALDVDDENPLPTGGRVDGASRPGGGHTLPQPLPRGGRGALGVDDENPLPTGGRVDGASRPGGGRLLERAKRLPSDTEIDRARRLRKDATEVEKLLWSKLRRNQLGAPFRRQEPILGFTVDFVCHDHRLIIELDGGQHAERVDSDERRTAVLQQAGFRVLRFWNNEVNDNLEGVLETILARMTETASPRRPPPQPLPRGGRGALGVDDQNPLPWGGRGALDVDDQNPLPAGGRVDGASRPGGGRS
jgi:crossover junction endodeoxyribonuclease RuvC